MNGRIKELYKSALKYAADDGEEVMVEKFAELIILECSEYVKECGMQPSVFTAADLLERFGVKISIPLGGEHERTN